MVHWCRSKGTVLSGFNFRILALPLRRAVWRAFRMSLTAPNRPRILTASGHSNEALLRGMATDLSTNCGRSFSFIAPQST